MEVVPRIALELSHHIGRLVVYHANDALGLVSELVGVVLASRKRSQYGRDLVGSGHPLIAVVPLILLSLVSHVHVDARSHAK